MRHNKVILPAVVSTIFLIFQSCASANKEVFNKSENFSKFLNTIPNCNEEISLVCSLPDSALFSNEIEGFYNYFPKEFDRVWLSLNISNSYKSIILGQTGDDIYPTLFTYSNDGKKIDSLSLVISFCGSADSSHIPFTSVTIDHDKITLIDSIKYIHYSDTDKQIIDSTEIKTVVKQISENGYFKDL